MQHSCAWGYADSKRLQTGLLRLLFRIHVESAEGERNGMIGKSKKYVNFAIGRLKENVNLTLTFYLRVYIMHRDPKF